MKRSEALLEIRHCGYVGDLAKAEEIALRKKVGVKAMQKAYSGGEKAKKNGYKCGCNKCNQNHKEEL